MIQTLRNMWIGYQILMYTHRTQKVCEFCNEGSDIDCTDGLIFIDIRITAKRIPEPLIYQEKILS